MAATWWTWRCTRSWRTSSQPEFSTVNVEELRHDATLQRPGSGLQGGPLTRGWIPVGRDTMLEQRMLADLRGRLGVIVKG